MSDGGRRLVVEADGGSRGNPGVAGYGALVRDPVDGRVLVELAEPLGQASNNVAEYTGLLRGLQAAARLDPAAQVVARLDSKLVVEQMSGRWKIKHEDMRRLALEARDVVQAIVRAGGSVEFEWVPRERNTAADALSNDAMDGRTVDRWHDDPPAARPSAPAAPEGLDPAPVVTALRLVLVHATDDPTVGDRVAVAVQHLTGPGATVLSDAAGAPLAAHVAATLGVRTRPDADWAGQREGIEAAYGRLVLGGGTVVLVTAGDTIETLLALVLGLDEAHRGALLTSPGGLTGVEVFTDGRVQVPFTNRTAHLA